MQEAITNEGTIPLISGTRTSDLFDGDGAERHAGLIVVILEPDMPLKPSISPIAVDH